jgi:biopolymer transport protein ExbB
MWNTLKSGGIWMIPIITCGILAVFIIIERMYYFITIKKRDQKLMSDIRDSLEKLDYSTAEKICAVTDTPCAQVIKKAISNRKVDEETLKEMVQTKMDSVVPEFEHLLTALGTIANISTLLGLLGTVTGNIRAFGVLSGGASDPASLAGAIAEALVTTAAGLIVSIPSVVFHNFFLNEVNHRITSMEANVTEVMFRLTGKRF